jgi:hypothetical protein
MARTAFALLSALCLVFLTMLASASAAARGETMSLLEIDESDASTNLGFDFQRLPRPGDRFAFKSGLYKWAGAKRGARIGRDEGICTFIRVPTSSTGGFSASAHCAAGMHLPAGEVLLEGFVQFGEGPATFDIPIVGGTGSYASARGYVHIHDLGGGDIGHSSLTFHIIQ